MIDDVKKLTVNLKQNNVLFCCYIVFCVCQASVCQSLVPMLFLTKRKKNMIGKAFEHWLTPNISEYEIFVISIWIAVI